MMLVSQTDRQRNDVVRIDSIATITLVAVMFWLDSSSFLKEVKITMFLNEKEKGKKRKQKERLWFVGVVSLVLSHGGARPRYQCLPGAVSFSCWANGNIVPSSFSNSTSLVNWAMAVGYLPMIGGFRLIDFRHEHFEMTWFPEIVK